MPSAVENCTHFKKLFLTCFRTLIFLENTVQSFCRISLTLGFCAISSSLDHDMHFFFQEDYSSDVYLSSASYQEAHD